MNDPASTWSDEYFLLTLDDSPAGVIWVHLDSYLVGSVPRVLPRRPEPPHEAWWVTIDFAYGTGPGDVEWRDDSIHATPQEYYGGLHWTDGDIHDVFFPDRELAYRVRAVSSDRAAWVRSWFDER